MNGIIHNCVHASPGNGGIDSKRYPSATPHYKKSTPDIFADVFKYIDNIVALLPPRRLLYMAIDGVAPRAKMNQQRSRRFRSAKERSDQHQRLMREDPMYAAADVDPFDSNCITPGTAFMHQLTIALKYFVTNKITTDPLWSNIRVVLSGAEAPGEGEHKIMEYIRAERESKRLSPNTRHCVYGLDADLIMLALVTHEPHFFILREKVDFTFWRKKRGPRLATALDITVFGEFELLSIGLLREYLVEDLGADNNSNLPFFDVERLTDDFVFILMLIGNDFLPNLPTLDIADGTLDVLLHLYKRVLPIFDGYLTFEGSIIPHRLEFFLAKLGLLEQDVLKAKKEMEANGSESRGRRAYRGKTFANVDLDILFGFHLMDPALLQKPFTPAMLKAETRALRQRLNESKLSQMKLDYYSDKFGQDMLEEGMQSLTKRYVEGLSWTLKYYMEGCRMWRWFYPYHYAPLASDIVDIADVLFHFDTNIVRQPPFRPVEQLMSVLPPKSSWCLPKPYRSLMMSANSPIRDFYPEEFQTDMNGKRNDWEAVVLLPFVDEERLLAAIRSVPASVLSDEEKQRNLLGPSLVYKRSHTAVEVVISPFKDRLPSFTSMASHTLLELPKIQDGRSFTAELFPGTHKPSEDDSLIDLPSLKRLEYATRLEQIGVNVFGMSSKSESLVLVMDFEFFEEQELGEAPEPQKSVSGISESDIAPGCPVWFGYPWRSPGYVEWIANAETTRKVLHVPRSDHRHSTSHVEAYKTIKGKFTNDLSTVLCDLYQKKAILISPPKELFGVKRIRPDTHNHYEVSDKAIFTHDRFVQKRTVPSLRKSHSLVKAKQPVMYIGHGPYFGHTCSVVRPTGSGSVLVQFKRSEASAKEAAFGYRIVSISSHAQRWFTTSRLAATVGLKTAVVDAVLGSLRVSLSSSKEEIDLGLGIKYIGRGLVVPGYAKKDEKGIFVFSDLCVDVLKNYHAAFPHLFQAIEQRKSDESLNGNGKGRGSFVYDAKQLFKASPSPDEGVRAAATWISVQDVAQQPLVSAPSQVLSAQVVGDLERHSRIVLALQDEYENSLRTARDAKHIKEVPRASLITGFEDPKDMSVFEANRGSSSFSPVPLNGLGLRLGDRVVNRIHGGNVPFGLRGTVVGIHDDDENVEQTVSESDQSEVSSTTLVEVVFDVGFISGGSLSGRCTRGRGKVVPAHHLLIVRPDRENPYYAQHYARMAAQVGIQLQAAAMGKTEQSQRRKAIAAAAAVVHEGAIARESEAIQDRSLRQWDGTTPPSVWANSYVPFQKQEVRAGLHSASSKESGPGLSATSRYPSTPEPVPIREDQLPLPRFVKRKMGRTDAQRKPVPSNARWKDPEEEKLPNGHSSTPEDSDEPLSAKAIQDHVLQVLRNQEEETPEKSKGPRKPASKRSRRQRPRTAWKSAATEDDDDEYASLWDALQEEARQKSKK